MSRFEFLFVAALAASFALPLAARADSAERELPAFKASRVEPLRVQECIGRGTGPMIPTRRERFFASLRPPCANWP